MQSSDKLNLVIQSFGGENEYRRCILSIWSFFAQVSAEWQGSNVFLFTDQPGFFKAYLEGLPVWYCLLTPEKIQEMRGELGFLHRMKIRIIEEVLNSSKENILYVDSDTFFVRDPAPLFRNIGKDNSVMHTNEYAFNWLKEMPLPAGAPFHAVLNVIEEHYFALPGGEKTRFSPALSSWNAGVIMLHSEQQRFLPDVYAITDQLYRQTKNHSCEQYAFSIVLQTKTDVLSCAEFVYHYWYRVKKQIVDRYLNNRINRSWCSFSMDRRKQEVKKWIEILPVYLDSHILMIRDNSIQAFNTNDFNQGYQWALKAFLKNPFGLTFMKDFLYHAKRHISGKGSER
jgi:hypothetical protein